MRKSVLFVAIFGLFLIGCGPKDELQYQARNNTYIENPDIIRTNNEQAMWIKQNFSNVGRAFVYNTNSGSNVELVLKRNITQAEFNSMGKDIASHIRGSSNSSSRILISELGLNSAVLRAGNF